MTNPTQLIEQLMKALQGAENILLFGTGYSQSAIEAGIGKMRVAMDAARAHLEQPTDPAIAALPVGELTDSACEVLATVMHFIPASEPALARDVSALCHTLRTAARPQPAREPLTNERAWELWQTVKDSASPVIDYANAIQAAHGITQGGKV